MMLIINENECISEELGTGTGMRMRKGPRAASSPESEYQQLENEERWAEPESGVYSSSSYLFNNFFFHFTACIRLWNNQGGLGLERNVLVLGLRDRM